MPAQTDLKLTPKDQAKALDNALKMFSDFLGKEEKDKTYLEFTKHFSGLVVSVPGYPTVGQNVRSHAGYLQIARGLAWVGHFGLQEKNQDALNCMLRRSNKLFTISELDKSLKEREGSELALSKLIEEKELNLGKIESKIASNIEELLRELTNASQKDLDHRTEALKNRVGEPWSYDYDALSKAIDEAIGKAHEGPESLSFLGKARNVARKVSASLGLNTDSIKISHLGKALSLCNDIINKKKEIEATSKDIEKLKNRKNTNEEGIRTLQANIKIANAGESIGVSDIFLMRGESKDSPGGGPSDLSFDLERILPVNSSFPGNVKQLVCESAASDINKKDELLESYKLLYNYKILSKEGYDRLCCRRALVMQADKIQTELEDHFKSTQESAWPLSQNAAANVALTVLVFLSCCIFVGIFIIKHRQKTVAAKNTAAIQENETKKKSVKSALAGFQGTGLFVIKPENRSAGRRSSGDSCRQSERKESYQGRTSQRRAESTDETSSLLRSRTEHS